MLIIKLRCLLRDGWEKDFFGARRKVLSAFVEAKSGVFGEMQLQ
jgi:hypothetical protein